VLANFLHYPSAALTVVLLFFVVVMPHCRSSASRLARRARALDRGFIVPCDGARHVLVPHSLQPRVKAFASSLSLHDKHDALAGTRSHFARLASVAAYRENHISLDELNVASKSHKRANSAKHGGPAFRDRAVHRWNWADVDDDVPSLPSPGGALDPAALGDFVAARCDAPRVDADLGCLAFPLPPVPCGAEHVSSAALPWSFFAKFELLIDRLMDKTDVTYQPHSKVPEEKGPSTTSETLVPIPETMTEEFNKLKAEVAELQVQLNRAVEVHKSLLAQVGGMTRAIVLEHSNSILEKVAVLQEASHTQILEALCSRDAARGAPLDALSPSPPASLANEEVESSPSPLPTPTSPPDLNESSDGQDLWDSGFISMGASVQLAGLVSAPHLNGCLGCVSGFDALKDRFAVAIKGAGTNLFKLVNMKIECSVCDEFSEPGELCLCAFGASESFQQSRSSDCSPTSVVQKTASCCSAAGSEPAIVAKSTCPGTS